MAPWDRLADGWGALSQGLSSAVDTLSDTPIIGIGVSSVRAPVGLAADLFTAPWNDQEDYNGFLNTLTSRLAVRMGDAYAGIDATTGGLASELGTKALDGYQWLWSNAVAQPVAAIHLTEAQILQGRSPDIAEAWHQAEHVSPGQAEFIAMGSAFERLGLDTGIKQYDLSTAEGVQAAVRATPGGSFVTGAYDFAANIALDPTVGAGKALKLTVAARRGIQAGSDVGRILEISRVNRFVEKAASMQPPARARWLYANRSLADPANPATPQLIDLIAKAEDSDQIRAILRTSINPTPATIATLRTEAADAADQLEVAMDNRNAFLQNELDGARSMLIPQWRDRRIAELNTAVENARGSAEYLQSLATIQEYGGIVRKPTVGIRQTISDTVGWDTWQPALYNVPARTLKSVATMRPGVVNFHEPASWINVARYLDQSGLDRESKGRLLLDWGRATGEGQQRAVLTRVEDAAAKAMAAKRGLPEQLVKTALEHGRTRRSELLAKLTDPAYTSIKRGDGRYLSVIDSDGAELNLPIFLSQLQNYHVLLPLDDMGRILSRYAAELRGNERGFAAVLDAVRSNRTVTGAAAGLEEIAQAFNNVWKPLTLMSLRYTVRNVTDEQLRTIALLGPVSSLSMFAKTARARSAEKTAAARLDILAGAQRELEQATDPRRVRQLTQIVKRLEGTEAAPLFGGSTEIMGLPVPDVYAGGRSPLRQAVSARDTVRTLNQDYGVALNRMRTSYADWKPSIAPADPEHKVAWTRAVNDQIIDDVIGEQILKGSTDAEVVAWLRSKEGQLHRRRIGARGGNPWKWAAEMRTQVETYIPTPELRAIGAKRALRYSDLEKAVPDPLLRPVVHGESLEVARRTSRTTRWLSDINDRIMDTLGAAPLDVMVRHPFAKLSYDRKFEELIRRLGPGPIDDATLDRLSERAAAHARNQVRLHMYDLAEQPNIARTLRFVFPFYGAWADSLGKWLRIFVTNPDKIGRAMQVWTFPQRAGWVEDSGGEQLIVVPMPKWAKDHIPGAKTIGELGWGREDLLSVTASQIPLLPGPGPLVAIPVGEVARDRPDLASSLRWFLPFGAGKNAFDLAGPAWVKRQVSKATEDRTYTATWTRIALDLEYERNIGRNTLTDSQIVDEAKRRAQAFYNLRTVVNLTMPAPQYFSPYQMYYDLARDYRDRFFTDGSPENGAGEPLYDTWDQWFLAEVGEEFFPFTAAMSKSLNGIAPTVEGYKVSKGFDDLLSKHPDQGGLIAGDLDDSGEFSQAVYEWQFRQGARRPIPPEEALRQNNVSAGWRIWSRASDAIDQVLKDRGLDSVADTGAEDLRAYKADLRVSLANTHPDWYSQFVAYDPEKTSIAVNEMASYVFDRRFDDRPGFDSLRDYIRARQAIVQLLNARARAGGSRDLQATTTNGDIKAWWDAFVGQLRQMDPAFAQIHSRYLDNDVISMGV